MDSSWHSVESCEGRKKADCEIDFKRGSVVYLKKIHSFPKQQPSALKPLLEHLTL